MTASFIPRPAARHLWSPGRFRVAERRAAKWAGEAAQPGRAGEAAQRRIPPFAKTRAAGSAALLPPFACSPAGLVSPAYADLKTGALNCGMPSFSLRNSWRIGLER